MEIIRLKPAHVAEYRALMLDAYDREPDAFTATVSERAPLDLEWWASRVSDDPESDEMVFGAFVGGRLVGVAGLRYDQRERTAHKAELYGMAVLPQFRGRGIARSLVEAALGQARSTPGTEVVRLRVTEANEAAVRLYETCGFVPFGTEPLGIRVGERYLSIVHMWCAVGPEAA